MGIELTFTTAWRSDDGGWSAEGNIISDSTNLALVAKALEEGRFLVVEHWHYRGSRAPDRVVVDDYEEFIDFLKENAVAGDSVHVFDVSEALEDGKQLVQGKCPDENGEVPERGAY